MRNKKNLTPEMLLQEVISLMTSDLGSQPTFTPRNIATLRQICTSLLNYDCPKGFLIFGDSGRGKTLAIRNIVKALKLGALDGFQNSKSIQSKDYKSILLDFGVSETLQRLKHENLYIDDLAFDGLDTFKHFGTDFNLVIEIVHARYNAFQNNRKFTLFTTNLTPEILEKKYGNKIYGRLLEMCQLSFWDGEDFRLTNESVVLNTIKAERKS